MPTSMFRICLVQFFSWFGWFTFEIYITDWVGTDVFHGDAHGDKHSQQYKDYYTGTFTFEKASLIFSLKEYNGDLLDWLALPLSRSLSHRWFRFSCENSGPS